jgi:hypothetical protein
MTNIPNARVQVPKAGLLNIKVFQPVTLFLPVDSHLIPKARCALTFTVKQI